MNPSTITKGKRGRPSFLKYPDEVSTKIRHDFQTGIILDLDTLIKNILQYDLEAGKKNGDGQISSISASEVQEKTIYAFLRRYNLPSIRDYKSAQRRKMNSDSRVHHKKCIERENESCTDEEYVSTTTTGFTSTSCNKSSVSDEGKETFFELFEKESISGEADKPTPESENNTNTQILLRKINQCENDLREKDETIEKLAKLHSSLSSKLSPSPLILSSEAEIAGKRIAYSCIRSLIQVLSPLDSILKWIVIFNNNKNDKTLHTNSGLLLKEDQVPINDNNAWFWNTLLNYEAENDKHTELREFETQLQKLCSRNNVSLTKHMTSSFIPPPPQKILDLIIQEHHHQKQRSDIENEGEILPFKKINLVPPENTKPFGTVRLKKWRPSTTTSDDDDHDKGKKATAVAEKAEEILLAEFTWDREKLKYVHMQWPQYKKEVTLKNFYKGLDYEMIGVIFGKQFAGDWRTHELLPHLGLNKYPTSYIFATRREGPLGNNTHWYLCFERVHSKPMLFYNFKDVLLHIPADCQKAYRVQLAVFRRRRCCHRPQQQEQQIETIIIQSPKNKILHPRFTATDNNPSQLENREESSSSDSGDEPLLKKGQTISTDLSGGGDCWNVGDVKNFVLKETWARKVWKKKIKFAPPPPLKHKDKYPNTETILKNKKSVMETLAMLCSSSTATTERTRSTDDDKYFCYHRSSEYSIGPRGGINQTEDLKRYYKQKQQQNKKSLFL